MAAEAEKAIVPLSVDLRRRRNKADAQTAGLRGGTAALVDLSGWNEQDVQASFRPALNYMSILHFFNLLAHLHRLPSLFHSLGGLRRVDISGIPSLYRLSDGFRVLLGLSPLTLKQLPRLELVAVRFVNLQTSLSEISEEEVLVDGGESSSTREEVLVYVGESSSTRETTEWTLLMTNVLLEGTSAILDQVGYALLGMMMAFVALVLSTIDLFRMAQKEKIAWDGRSLLPCFRRHSTRDLATRKPFGTIVEYFGFFGAVWQCFYSTMEYAYSRQNKDNPIKMSLLPFIFLVCVIFSKKIKHAHSSQD